MSIKDISDTITRSSWNHSILLRSGPIAWIGAPRVSLAWRHGIRPVIGSVWVIIYTWIYVVDILSRSGFQWVRSIPFVFLSRIWGYWKGWGRPRMEGSLGRICESSSIAVYPTVSDASYAYMEGWRIRLGTSITSLGNADTCRILVLSQGSIYIHIYIYIYILYPLIVPSMDDYIDHNAPWETFHSSQPSRPL